MGTEKFLKCEQKLGHDAMYWYKQDSKKLLQIMFIYNNKVLIHNETVPRRFSPESHDKAHLNLRVSSLETGDSAEYLCASSQHSLAESLPPSAQTPRPRQKAAGATCSPDPEAPFPPVRPLDWSFPSVVQAAGIHDGAFLYLCSRKSSRIVLIS